MFEKGMLATRQTASTLIKSDNTNVTGEEFMAAQPRYNDSPEEERSLALPMLHLNSGDLADRWSHAT